MTERGTAAIASATDAGMTPARASARARATSKRSIAESSASFENASSSASVVTRLSMSRTLTAGHTSKKTVSSCPCSRM